MKPRTAALAGVIGPVGFLFSCFGLALIRGDVIASYGWAAWPSSMASGGVAGVPMMLTFLWLAGCYVVFSLGAIRPRFGRPVLWVGFLAIALSDVLLTFPSNPADPGAGIAADLHTTGVLLATLATLVVAIALSLVTRNDVRWRLWHVLGAPAIVTGVFIGLLAGTVSAPAKVAYVILVTAPVPIAALLVRRDASASEEPPSQAALD